MLKKPAAKNAAKREKNSPTFKGALGREWRWWRILIPHYGLPYVSLYLRYKRNKTKRRRFIIGFAAFVRKIMKGCCPITRLSGVPN
jgi:hypothetical protein